MPKRSYTSDAGEQRAISTEGLSFELDGVTFDCHGEFDANDMQDLAAALMDADETHVDIEALGAMGNLFRTILGADTHKAFRRHRRDHHTNPDVVSQIMLDLIEDITSRDPQKRSASPAGRPALAGRPSTAASPSPGKAGRSGNPARRAAAAAGRAIPAEWAAAGDVVTAPDRGGPPAEPQMTRVINLGNASRTRVEQAG